ncbi:MAG: D-2-hydroxyacid dehydrogenase [Firmicutes bacterium]|nr:D-2-hydroxyacid dehydrogenase [Bacillota bacterium]
MDRKVVCYLKPTTLEYYLTVPPEVPHRLAEAGFDFVYCETAEEFFRNLPEAEIVITADFKPEWIKLAPKLKWVTTNAAGKERIAERDLLEHGVKVSFGRYHGQIMAETVIGMMLFSARGLGRAYRLQRQEPWCAPILQQHNLHVLRGKTCVILGLGRIGKHIARLTKAFGMYNIGVKRKVTAPPEDVDEIAPLEKLHEVLPLADHLVIVLPNVPETTNLIGANELALLKPTATLHNVGRGNCIDENALYQTLKREQIQFACLDVFQVEPLPVKSPLRTLDNVLILPHSSAFAPEYYELYFQEFLRDFEEYCK